MFQSRTLQEKKDDALTELAELKRLMSVIVKYHQEEVDNKIDCLQHIILFVVCSKEVQLYRGIKKIMQNGKGSVKQNRPNSCLIFSSTWLLESNIVVE